MAKVIILLCVIFLSVYTTEQAHFLQRSYIDKINKVATTWKAGENFHPNTPKEAILNKLGSKGVEFAAKTNGPYKTSDPKYEPTERIKKRFDARKHWFCCKPIRKVRDQGNCASSWAFSTTGAFSDRMCIKTHGDFQEMLSPEYLISCCPKCGFGCYGGLPIRAWEHFIKPGVVTGGDYNTTEGCQPYTVPPCKHYEKEEEGSCSQQPLERRHKCSKSCFGDETLDYDFDHWKSKDAYYIPYENIQKELQAYGPVEASFSVYDDFVNYRWGVYTKSKFAIYLGELSVKLIGWGVEYGVDYWLAMNSWGEDWGDYGLFKIRRGTNECGIDNSTTAGIPLYGYYDDEELIV